MFRTAYGRHPDGGADGDGKSDKTVSDDDGMLRSLDQCSSKLVSVRLVAAMFVPKGAAALSSILASARSPHHTSQIPTTHCCLQPGKLKQCVMWIIHKSQAGGEEHLLTHCSMHRTREVRQIFPSFASACLHDAMINADQCKAYTYMCVPCGICRYICIYIPGWSAARDSILAGAARA